MDSQEGSKSRDFQFCLIDMRPLSKRMFVNNETGDDYNNLGDCNALMRAENKGNNNDS